MSLDCTCNRLKEAEAKAAKWDALVRCGECKHLYDVMGYLECERSSGEYFAVTHEDYCSRGERREA